MLYTYILKPNDVLENGIKAPVSIKEELLSHYAMRAKSNSKRDIVNYLETVFQGRSKAISCLTEQIPDLNCRKLSGFKALRECFEFPADIIENKEIVEAVWCVENGVFRKTNSFDFSVLPWETVQDGDDVFFAKIRHYMLVLKQGCLPAQYIKRASD